LDTKFVLFLDGLDQMMEEQIEDETTVNDSYSVT
jgi:hypothetical protein